MPTQVEELAEQIKAMTPADQLRLAAGLIEQGNIRTAESITRLVLHELALARLLPKRT